VVLDLAADATRVPEGFHLHPKLARQFEQRARMVADGQVDWALGEAIALGSVVLEGTDVRLTGQDTRRGTFSQRHAVLVDHETGAEWIPLAHLDGSSAVRGKPGRFAVHDSLLSEYAALGFEYGYSVESPEALVCWEAQFGDFANGAQVIIDNFLVAAEDKWGQRCGLVMLLPHGYEGQGPEHSSARLERFLQAAAEEDIQVANVTTPAQYFHLLRRQVRRDFRKPLIVMSPKSLLRHPAAVSRIPELVEGGFQEILEEPSAPERPGRVIFCSGKVYYDLCDYREKNAMNDTAIVRIEQLYPLHVERLREIAKRTQGARIVWCQEESENMGAWSWIWPQLTDIFKVIPLYAGRDASASPAVGSLALHKLELAGLLKDAYTL
jgi:2-oxoglutarate dehydrogenase E1 component